VSFTDAELTTLLDDIESDRVERKSSAADRDRLREAICAFSNDLPNHGRPGVLFVGVDDEGDPSGLPITDELLLQLAGWARDGSFQPLPSLSVEKRHLKGADVAVVTVMPSSSPPVRFRGRVWIRVGPRRDVASVDEERRLSEKRRARDVPFDVRPLTTAGVDCLDLTYFEREYLPMAIAPDVLERNQRSSDERLAALKLAAIDDDCLVPTVLGILVAGHDPLQYVPCAYVQFLRFGGLTMTDPIKDQKVLSGRLIDVLRDLDELLSLHVAIATDFTSAPVERRRPDYPLVALEQIVRNAVMHRTYEGTHAPIRINWFLDRLEVLSPGGPFGAVSVENFGRPNAADYRNPNVAAAMKDLGYAQRFGLGLIIAEAALKDNGNPPIEHRVEPSFVLEVIRRSQS